MRLKTVAGAVVALSLMLSAISALAAEAVRLAIHVDENDPAKMALALNNAENVEKYYRDLGQEVFIEIVAYGPGLAMLREDTSPVKARLSAMSLEMPGLTLSACGNTMTAMEKKEGKPVALISEAKVVTAGVVRLIELQQQGYAYVKP
jgi:intracellular sulfur oxidation DsrE/DsrF family protein